MKPINKSVLRLEDKFWSIEFKEGCLLEKWGYVSGKKIMLYGQKKTETTTPKEKAADMIKSKVVHGYKPAKL